MNLREWSLKMRQTKVSPNTQLYSEHQTVYTLRVKSHRSKVSRHKDEPRVAGKLHVARTWLSIEVYK